MLGTVHLESKETSFGCERLLGGLKWHYINLLHFLHKNKSKEVCKDTVFSMDSLGNPSSFVHQMGSLRAQKI
jgi:hypothetical protein